MAKVLNEYAPFVGITFTAADITSRNDIGDGAVVGNTAEISNITMTNIRDVLGETSNSLSVLSTSVNINEWSAFSPLELEVDDDHNFIFTSTTPYEMGEFAGYNHTAIIPYASFYTPEGTATTFFETGEGCTTGPTVPYANINFAVNVGEFDYSQIDEFESAGVRLTIADWVVDRVTLPELTKLSSTEIGVAAPGVSRMIYARRWTSTSHTFNVSLYLTKASDGTQYAIPSQPNQTITVTLNENATHPENRTNAAVFYGYDGGHSDGIIFAPDTNGFTVQAYNLTCLQGVEDRFGIITYEEIAAGTPIDIHFGVADAANPSAVTWGDHASMPYVQGGITVSGDIPVHGYGKCNVVYHVYITEPNDTPPSTVPE